MSIETSMPPISPRTAARVSVLLIVLLGIASALTLCTVKVANEIKNTSHDPTPYGYTVALLFWVIPIVAIAFWLLPGERLLAPRRAFWITVAILVLFSFAGEYFFVHMFWYFPNTGATLEAIGIKAPAYKTAGIPVEEYLFYVAAFICALLVYIWCDEYWLSAYHSPVRVMGRITDFRPLPLIIAVLLIAGAAYYKLVILGEQGFPCYFTFQVLAVQLPCIFLIPSVRAMINWRAFTVMYFFTVMVGVLFEATLAVPFQWWKYYDTGMMGIYIKGWSNLPIEAVILWLAGGYMSIIVYHVVKRHVEARLFPQA